MARGSTLSISIVADDNTSAGFRSASANVEGFSNKVGTGAVALGSFIGTVTAQALPAAIDFGKELFTLGQSAEIMGRKANTVFGTSAGDIKAWADQVNESFGVSDEAVVGMAANMGDLLVPMGFTRQAAADMSKETLNAAAALSAWSGGQYDSAEVADIMTKAMLGERDGLKALGISINQAEVDQRALQIAQAEGRSEVTAMDEALATQQLMLEKSSDAQKAWADGTMDAVKRQNELKATIDDAKQALAARLVPAVQATISWISTKFVPAVRQLVDDFRERWPKIKEAVEPTLNWFRETVEDVWTVIAALWQTYGETIVEYTLAVWEPIKDIIEGTMLVIKGIIDTVMGILTGDWDKAWGGIKAIVDGVWQAISGLVRLAIENVKLVVKLGLDSVKAVFSNVWDGIKSVVSSAVDAVVGFVLGIPGRLAGYVVGLFAGIKEAITGAKDWVGQKVDQIVGYFTNLPGRMPSFGGMFDGIKTAFRAALNFVIDKWNGLEFTVPKVSLGPFGSFGGWTIGTPDIPRLHQGGIVPGPLGQEVPVILQAGERVLTRQQQRDMSTGDVHLHLHLDGQFLGTPDQFGRAAISAITNAQRNGATLPFLTGYQRRIA